MALFPTWVEKWRGFNVRSRRIVDQGEMHGYSHISVVDGPDDSPGDFVDAFIENLRDSSPGSDRFDEDTIRATLGAMLNEEGD